ncbi:hypothetical protein CPC08DRAFT_769275 [Agrocybe pediades]|nr:hypothetical protein CPC08DRAFT_769275 [Agrocybe pediades]
MATAPDSTFTTSQADSAIRPTAYDVFLRQKLSEGYSEEHIYHKWQTATSIERIFWERRAWTETWVSQHSPKRQTKKDTSKPKDPSGVKQETPEEFSKRMKRNEQQRLRSPKKKQAQQKGTK